MESELPVVEDVVGAHEPLALLGAAVGSDVEGPRRPDPRGVLEDGPAVHVKVPVSIDRRHRD